LPRFFYRKSSFYDATVLILGNKRRAASSTSIFRKKSELGAEATGQTQEFAMRFIARKYIDERTRVALEGIIALKDNSQTQMRLQAISSDCVRISHCNCGS
jgi:hypothetical protein